MPELPEVETIRRDLQRVLKDKKITRVQVRKAKMVRGSARAFERGLKGQRIESIKRRGKLLIVKLGGKWMLIHLKMTGQLIYVDGRGVVAGGHGELPFDVAQGKPNKHTHVIFCFSDKSRLYFNDLRQFGYLAVVDEDEKNKIVRGYGVEPLSRSFAAARLGKILAGRGAPLKSALLDQSKIAGLGSIYGDEACFLAGVRPTRRAGRLTGKEVARLHCGIQRVLRRAIKYRGTTFNDYIDARGRRGGFVKLLKVYGREGEKCYRPACRRAGVVIKRVRVGGRSASYCPRCQA